MKLHATNTKQYQTITAYERDRVEINATWFDMSLIVMPELEPMVWQVASFESLEVNSFSDIQKLQPDVLILGTGNKQRFVHPKLIANLTDSRVGVECMDNQAACRTYNILMAEGRRVALALIMESY